MAKAARVKLRAIRFISEVPAGGPMPYHEKLAGSPYRPVKERFNV